MDENALFEHKVQLERERDAELKACRAKWRRKIDAVDILLKVATTGSTGSQSGSNPLSRIAGCVDVLEQRVKQDRKQRVMDVVRQAVEETPGPFTARMLVETINETKPFSLTERDVGNPLWRLCQSGRITIEVKGTGRKPNLYFNPKLKPISD